MARKIAWEQPLARITSSARCQYAQCFEIPEVRGAWGWENFFATAARASGNPHEWGYPGNVTTWQRSASTIAFMGKQRLWDRFIYRSWNLKVAKDSGIALELSKRSGWQVYQWKAKSKVCQDVAVFSSYQQWHELDSSFYWNSASIPSCTIIYRNELSEGVMFQCRDMFVLCMAKAIRKKSRNKKKCVFWESNPGPCLRRATYYPLY